MKLLHIALVFGVTATASLASAASAPIAALPLVTRWQVFSDPREGAFSIEMPQGWKNSGGTARRNALQYRGWALSVSPDGATTLAANDPTEPSYVTPSPLFAAAGLGIGRLYAGGGGTVYLIEPYRPAAQYASFWGRKKLAARCADLRLAGSRARPELAAKVNAYSRSLGVVHDYGEATFFCREEGRDMTAYVLVGTTFIPGGIWYADTIEAFLAPTPVAGIAAGLLAHMVQSVRLNPSWVARQTRSEADVSRIATQTNADISNSIMQGWEERGAQYDRVMEEGSRARLGVDVYADPATGTKYTVANTHQFYWVDAGGTVTGTDTDTPPGPSFTRLNRVPPR